jgi:ABC-type transporter Mla MlaB component
MALARAVATVVLVRGRAALFSWPLPAERTADLATVELLARWQLEARRRGCYIELRAADPHLQELLDLAGLLRGPGNPGGIAVAADELPASSPS